MFGGVLRSEHAVADQTPTHATDNKKGLAHEFDLTLLH